MTIRPATPADGPACAAVLVEAGLALPGLDYTRFEGLTLVADEAGAVVGMIHVLLGRPYCLVAELAVRPAVKGTGIGAALLAHAETVLRVLGYGAWYGAIADPDVVAQAARGGAERLGATTGVLKRL